MEKAWLPSSRRLSVSKMASGIYIDTINMGQWVKGKEDLRGISGRL
jgi:hypothetical protein